MEILKPFEKFESNPDKVLRVDKDSEIYYIFKDDENYIAWKKIDSTKVINEEENKVEYTNSYYNVIDGEHILTGTTIHSKYKKSKRNGGAKVYKLFNLIKVKGVEQYDLTIDEIYTIVNEDNKDYKSLI